MSLITLLKGFFIVVGGLSAIVTIFNYFKIKPMTLYKALKSQSGIMLICSLVITVILFLGPWNKLHYGDIKQTVIHDTIWKPVYKKDTVYIHDKVAKKNFENKIGKVGTLNEN